MARASQRLTGFHAVREALRSGARALQYIAVDRSRRDERVRELIELARAANVPVRLESGQMIDRLASGTRHQGVVAIAAAKAAIELTDLLAAHPAPTRPLLLALDGIEDPHNLGAILRTASGAGVAGVILPSRRSVGLTDTVARVSAGALEYIQVAVVGNLADALEQTKKAGFWTIGLDAHASQPYWKQDLTLAAVIVTGAEGKGLHELTRKRCDYLGSIPMHTGVDSLNASVATAIVLYEAVRQRALRQSS